MIRVVVFLIVLAFAALAVDLLSTLPGPIQVIMPGYTLTLTPVVAIGVVIIAAALLIVVWSVLRAVFGAPKKMVRSSRMRRRARGFTALSSGVVAVGAGNSREAKRHAREAERLLPDEPLTQLLKAQAAQLSGDRATAEASFTQMLKMPETRTLGLRGLHLEARRRGDHEAAYQFAEKAREIAPLPWAGQASLQHLAANGDWDGALAVIERNADAAIVDKVTADRQRAVLKTASAEQKFDREPATALAMAREANRLAPDLVPAAVLTARLLIRQGDISRAMRVLEVAWKRCAHPEIAAAYLGVRPGDSARDRLARAQELGQWALEDQEGKIVVGRAALEARDADLARKTMMPVFDPKSELGRPTRRACLLMADIEEYSGNPGKVREWLTRASSASKDAAWIADGVVSSEWAPTSPVTGKLDAFVWQKPPEHLTALPPPIIIPTEREDGSRIESGGPGEPIALPPPEAKRSEAENSQAENFQAEHSEGQPTRHHMPEPVTITSA